MPGVCPLLLTDSSPEGEATGGRLAPRPGSGPAGALWPENTGSSQPLRTYALSLSGQMEKTGCDLPKVIHLVRRKLPSEPSAEAQKQSQLPPPPPSPPEAWRGFKRGTAASDPRRDCPVPRLPGAGTSRPPSGSRGHLGSACHPRSRLPLRRAHKFLSPARPVEVRGPGAERPGSAAGQARGTRRTAPATGSPPARLGRCPRPGR